MDVADANVAVNQKALELEVIGPRKEDVAQAEAQLRDDDAQVALMRQELADAQLVAPCDAVVRSRLMEPGEMASPQTPVFSLAITDPKWVRAYVDEPDLGSVHPGMAATVTVDSFPAPASMDGSDLSHQWPSLRQRMSRPRNCGPAWFTRFAFS